MRVGFLVWNRFQVAHAAEISKHFDEPDFIFTNRDEAALVGFNPDWLTPYGACTRFISELDIHSLDGQYDAIVTQFRPPMKRAWKTTRLVIQQYSLAKPKTAYNSRWFAADHGLVYGDYSESIIGEMCAVSKVGNPRFDPFFERRLDQDILENIRAHLDPSKKTVLYQPTWGDLNSSADFLTALGQLEDEFNVITRPHHMSAIRKEGQGEVEGIISLRDLPDILDLGIYLNDVADVVVSDMSGAIFDALYCGKKVVLIGDEGSGLEAHKKADPTAIEVSERHRIGPYVSNPAGLRKAISEVSRTVEAYREENESIVRECFHRRGGGAALAADAIRGAVESEGGRPPLQIYAAPNFNDVLSKRTYSVAQARELRRKRRVRQGLRKKSPNKPKTTSFIKNQSFFSAGMRLEEWATDRPSNMAGRIYQAFNATSALRYSQFAWKQALTRLFDIGYASSVHADRETLRKLGMFRTVESLYIQEGASVPPELSASTQALGPLADFCDLAGRNELAPADKQWYISADGSIRLLEGRPAGAVVELYLALSMFRQLKDEALRPYRSEQLKFAQNLFKELRKLGVGVYPRLQGGVTGVAPVTGRDDIVKLMWHTVDDGRNRNIHLKLGTLFGHFILDSKGYSGWSSITDADFDVLTRDVDPLEADAHWNDLYLRLVGGGKSKYAQEEDEGPEISDYLFFPMQVANDTVARLADIDTLSLLRALASWARTSAIRVVVKRHPMCKSRAIADALAQEEAAGAIVVSNASVHSLISNAQGVVTVNSGVGAEALLHLKPVITTGASDYAVATSRVSSVDELVALLDGDAWRVVDREKIKKFLWIYTKRYMVECADTAALSVRLGALLKQVGLALPKEGQVDVEDIGPDAWREPVTFFHEDVSVWLRYSEGRRQAYVENLRKLLDDLALRGVRTWLDGRSLVKLRIAGEVGLEDQSLQLGGVVSDRVNLRKNIRQCVEASGLSCEFRAVDGLPIRVIAKAKERGPWSGPHLVISLYYEVEEGGWSPRRVSLLRDRARYPATLYREFVSALPAPLGEKLKFFTSYPRMGLSIALGGLGVSDRLDRMMKDSGRSSAIRKFLSAVFYEYRQVLVPRKYLECLASLELHGARIPVPGDLDPYLSNRYGLGDVGVVDPRAGRSSPKDAFLSPIDRSQFDLKMNEVRSLSASQAVGVIQEGPDIKVE